MTKREGVRVREGGREGVREREGESAMRKIMEET